MTAAVLALCRRRIAVVTVEKEVLALRLRAYFADGFVVIHDPPAPVDNRRRTLLASLVQNDDARAPDPPHAVEGIARLHDGVDDRLGRAVKLVDVAHSEVAHQLRAVGGGGAVS